MLKNTTKKIFILCTCTLLTTSVSASNITDYKTAKKGSIVISADPENELANTLTTEYKLYKKETKEEELFDSYLLESISYFSDQGGEIKITHVTNDFEIAFESNECSITKLIGGENKFISFFSNFNDIKKAKMKSASAYMNKWEVQRSFYAGNRYFDSSYTFRYLTYFSIPTGNEVRLELIVDGQFEEFDFDEEIVKIENNVKVK